MHEETGYGSGKDGEANASLREVSSILVKDPGYVAVLNDGDISELTGSSMTGATMQLATVDVKLGESDEEPEQHLDEVRLSYGRPAEPGRSQLTLCRESILYAASFP